MKDKITGTVYVFGNNIDTDQIYPGKYVEYTEIEDIKKYAMSGSAIPNLVELFKPGDIIIGGTNFGCGSSREHAVMTLKGIGIGAILAESFARIFYRNAINLGVPAITCKAINTMFKTGEQAEMNFINGNITNLTTGESRQFEPVGDYMMNILKHGGIKPMIKEQLNCID